MTTSQAKAFVQMLLRDPTPETYVTTISGRDLILDSLIQAQKELGLLLHESYLPELILPSGTKTTSAAGILTFTNMIPTASSGVLGGASGILRVQYFGGRWMRRISDIEELNNTYSTPATTDPAYRVLDSSIYIYPAAAVAVNVEFKNAPKDMDTSTVNPVIAASLHELMCKLAEAYCRATVNRDNELTQLAFKTAYDEIKNLNKQAGA